MMYLWIILAFTAGVVVGDFTPQFLLSWYVKVTDAYKELTK